VSSIHPQPGLTGKEKKKARSLEEWCCFLSSTRNGYFSSKEILLDGTMTLNKISTPNPTNRLAALACSCILVDHTRVDIQPGVPLWQYQLSKWNI
jgi:hypothetical protein